MSKLTFVLGATDPEMVQIEKLAESVGASVVYATAGGRRVHPGNAYKADGVTGPVEGRVITVECCVEGVTPGVRVDHHNPGDPGYGRPPAEYWEASSIGQVFGVLLEEGLVVGKVPTGLRLVAAADHCLGAAYQDLCPGVDPGDLMERRAADRAAFQKREVEDVLADIQATTEALKAAAQVTLEGAHECPWHASGHRQGDDCLNLAGSDYADPCKGEVRVADMRRDPPWPELTEAATRLGAGYISGPLEAPDGRMKFTCSGSAEQVRAFLQVWAPAQGLVDLYGDPARGFAGGYEP